MILSKVKLAALIIGVSGVVAIYAGVKWKISDLEGQIEDLEGQLGSCTAEKVLLRKTNQTNLEELNEIRQVSQERLEALTALAEVKDQIVARNRAERERNEQNLEDMRIELANAQSTECSSALVRPEFRSLYSELLRANREDRASRSAEGSDR